VLDVNLLRQGGKFTSPAAAGGLDEVTINILEISAPGRPSRRALLSTSANSPAEETNLSVKTEVIFSSGDSELAKAFALALSETPSTVFPVSEFGEVLVPDVSIFNISSSSNWMPILIGVLAGVAGTYSPGPLIIFSDIVLSTKQSKFFYVLCSLLAWCSMGNTASQNAEIWSSEVSRIDSAWKCKT